MDKAGVAGFFMAWIPMGTVKAVAQEYPVFRTAGGFLMFSPSNRGSLSFHMTHMPARKVQALARMIGKGGVTSASFLRDKRLDEAFGSEDKVAARSTSSWRYMCS